MVEPGKRVYTFCPNFFILSGNDTYCKAFKGIVSCPRSLVSTSEAQDVCYHFGRTVEDIFKDTRNPNPITFSEARIQYEKKNSLETLEEERLYKKVETKEITPPPKPPKTRRTYKYTSRGLLGKILQCMETEGITLSNRKFMAIRDMSELPGIEKSLFNEYYVRPKLYKQYRSGVLWKASRSERPWLMYSLNDLGLPPLEEAVKILEIGDESSFDEPCLLDYDGNVKEDIWLERAIRELSKTPTPIR